MGLNRSYYNNVDKIENLENFREKSINDMTSKQLKILLNKLGKTDNYIQLLKLMLDTEDANISAKKYSFSKHYKDMYYEKKENLLKELLSVITEYNDIHYGKGNDETCHITSNVIFVQLKQINKQISWHTTLNLNISKFKYNYDKSKQTTIERILEEITEYFNINNISLNYEEHFKKVKKIKEKI
jgi:hypothetical protein